MHRAPHYLLVGGVGISSFQSNAYMAITMSISYSMASLFLAHKYCNPFPIFKLFSSIPRTRPPHIPPRVEPDHFSTRASSFQRTTAGQSCVSPSHWQMKRRSPLRSITIPQTVKVMPWSVISLFFFSPSNWVGKKTVTDIPCWAHSGHYC